MGATMYINEWLSSAPLTVEGFFLLANFLE